MPRSIVGFRRKKAAVISILKSYFRRPLNSIPLALLAIGVVVLYISFGYHPIVTQPISQSSDYAVTPNATLYNSFTLFPEKTTYVSFTIPAGEEVNYSLSTLIELKIQPTLNNPGGVKVVTHMIAKGIASANTSLVIPSQNLGTSLATYFSMHSVSGANFNVTVTSVAYYNTTLSFLPAYALAGMALTVGSITILASVAGVKREEY